MLANDPLANRLGSSERRRRLVAVCSYAQQRLEYLSSPGSVDRRRVALAVEWSTFERSIEATSGTGTGHDRDGHRADRSHGDSWSHSAGPRRRSTRPVLIGRATEASESTVSAPPRAQQLRLRENQLFLILTIVIGVMAGLAAVLFTVAIEQTSHRLFGLAPSRLRLFAVPPLMSLVTGVLLAKVFPDVRGSGVPQTEAAYHLAGGVIPARVPFGKFITGVLCIGSGHSMGREGPSVQIGAGLASVIGRWLHLSPQRVRDLVPVGAAGAFAAAFNTPVAAVLFALEEIIGDMNAALLGSTVVASVAAVIVERSILGNEPLFHVPTYRLVHPAELLAYAALGVFGGVVSLLFCKACWRSGPRSCACRRERRSSSPRSEAW